MGFVDDNPVKRKLVSDRLPLLETPQMPEDLALFVRTFDRQGYFETVAFSEEDKVRGEMYRQNAQRKDVKADFTSISDFLRDLHMVGEMDDVDSFHLPCSSQLINKSNQFHLTTTRYSETDVAEMMAGASKICRYYKLQDHFGDNGRISVVLLEKTGDKLHIDAWVMSCRVFASGIEEFIHNDMVNIAHENGCVTIIGAPRKTNWWQDFMNG